MIGGKEQEIFGGEIISTENLSCPECDKNGGSKDNSICAPHIKDSVCAGVGIDKMKDFLKKKSVKTVEMSNPEIVDKMLQFLELTDKSEAAIWKNDEFRTFAGENFSDDILNDRYLPEGPCCSTELLSNFDIDKTLDQWSKHSLELFKKKFFHIPYQMIDFANYNTEFERLNIEDLKKQKYDCFAVIINTDITCQGGIHWFCLYGDIHTTGSDNDPYIIEYFNSSGKPPRKQITEWICKKELELLKISKHLDTKASVPRQLQKSNTECGMWSLLYIRDRLKGITPESFYKINKTGDEKDSFIVEQRKELFRISQ